MSAAASPALAVRVFVSFLVARAAFGITYLGSAVGGLRVFWYYPLAHRWELVDKPSGPAMGWFGLTAIALVAAAVSFAITYAASARGPLARALGRGGVVLAIARFGGLVLLLDFAYFGWTLTHDERKPWAPPACVRSAN